MQNIRDLRESLVDNYEQMKAKQMPIKTGRELTNAAGKIINSLKLELDYNSFMEQKVSIPFLEVKE